MDVICGGARRQWRRRQSVTFNGAALALAYRRIAGKKLRRIFAVVHIWVNIHEGCPVAVTMAITSSIHIAIAIPHIICPHGCWACRVVIRMGVALRLDRVAIHLRGLIHPLRVLGVITIVVRRG
jgi:hypothetical protein